MKIPAEKPRGPKTQEKHLLEILHKNPYLIEILQSDPFPDGKPWYVAAGAITQTVWNELSGLEPTFGIEDYDLIYFDENVDPKEEKKHSDRVQKLVQHLPVTVEVVNEGRVHQWFEEYFGKSITPYTSCEDAIDSWTPCSAIGVTKRDGKLHVYSPFGLDDLFSITMRPNKNHQAHVVEFAYNRKVEKWKKKWPQLTVISWK